ncbi:MAG TPA: hypothetical protein VH988_03825 [Thermoanaerobaculia bacterium]|nr:hypothetical protein [Thermoanaerobaculia bacterium]
MHPLILLPQIILPLWFLAGQPHRLIHPKSFATWSNLFLDPAVYAFGGWPQRLILIFAFLLLLLLTLWRRSRTENARRWREEDGWLILAACLVIVYLCAPDRMAGGSLLKLRLALYEAWTGYFPVRFQESVADIPTDQIMTDPKRVDPRSLGGEIDYFYCWSLQPDSDAAHWLDRRYRLIRQEGLATLFERRDRVRRARQAAETGM